MATLTDQLLVRVDPTVRERLEAYMATMHERFGVRVSLAAAARAAMDRGLDALEVDLASTKKKGGR